MFLRLALVLACIAAAVGGAEQTTPVEKPLTNADLVGMLRARLPESTITLVIRTAGSRGNTDFDASPSALIALKELGATEQILNAVLAAPEYRPPSRPTYQPSSVVDGLPRQRGLYFQTVSGWARLPSLLLFPELARDWRGLGAHNERRYVVPGRYAPLRITERLPAFYLRDRDPAGDWAILRLVEKRRHREVRGKIVGMYPQVRRLLLETGELLPLRVSSPADDVLVLHPPADLDPGEYLLVQFPPGQQSAFTGYEFAVETDPNGPS